MSKPHQPTAAPRPAPAPASRGGAGQGKGAGNAGGWPSTVPNVESGKKRSYNPPPIPKIASGN